MCTEDKELLLKDLCSRLPYGVKCQYTCVVQEGTLVGKSNWIGELKGIVPLSNGHIGFMVDCDKIDALEGNIKPCLRPMSSMTEEEREEARELFFMNSDNFDIDDVGEIFTESQPFESVYTLSLFRLSNYIDWLIAHHFDYRGLIEKGLAIAVTKENNPYKEE